MFTGCSSLSGKHRSMESFLEGSGQAGCPEVSPARPFLLPSPQPMEVFVDDETKLTLHGLQQYYVKLKDSEKNRKLFDLLDVLEFNQVIPLLPFEGRWAFGRTAHGDRGPDSAAFLWQVVIFVKSVQRCMALAQLLVEQNFPAIAIHRGMAQEER